MVALGWSLLLLCVLSGAPPASSRGLCTGHKLIRSGGLTCQDRQTILTEHNRLRQSLALGAVRGQPAAANMRELVWDENLALLAQRWADQCIIAHDTVRSDVAGRFPVGQNLAATWTTRSSVSPEPDFARQISGWFGEGQAFDYQFTDHPAATGHYSQLVWADTFLLGCGYTFYYDKSRGYTKLYVCNYGPGGNVIGEKPYSSGAPSCGLNGLSASAKYRGLCDVRGTSSPGGACGYSAGSPFSSNRVTAVEQYSAGSPFSSNRATAVGQYSAGSPFSSNRATSVGQYSAGPAFSSNRATSVGQYRAGSAFSSDRATAVGQYSAGSPFSSDTATAVGQYSAGSPFSSDRATAVGQYSAGPAFSSDRATAVGQYSAGSPFSSNRATAVGQYSAGSPFSSDRVSSVGFASYYGK